MARTVFVTCPGCESLLEVNAENGKVVKHHPPSEKLKEGEDPLQKALQMMKDKAATREDRFKQAKKDEDAHKKDLTHLFDQEKKRIREEGPITKPDLSPFDLD